MGKVGAIEDLGEKAQQKVIQKKASGLSSNTIAEEINDEFDSDISGKDVRNFIDRTRSKSIKLLKEEDKFQEKLAEQYFNTISRLNELHAEMWRVFSDLTQNPEHKELKLKCPYCTEEHTYKVRDYGSLIKTADHLLKQIAHVDEVLGKISKKQLNITYNVVDLSKKLTNVMPQLLSKMEKQGSIKIKRKRLKEVYN